MRRHNPHDKHPDDEDFTDRCAARNCPRHGQWLIAGKQYCDRHYRHFRRTARKLGKRTQQNDTPGDPL